jgi:hypothetical protein
MKGHAGELLIKEGNCISLTHYDMGEKVDNIVYVEMTLLDRKEKLPISFRYWPC